jgi:hypothetical protein
MVSSARIEADVSIGRRLRHAAMHNAARAVQRIFEDAASGDQAAYGPTIMPLLTAAAFCSSERAPPCAPAPPVRPC